MGKQWEDKQEEDKQLDSLVEPEEEGDIRKAVHMLVEGDIRKAVHMLVEVDTQPMEEKAGRYETSVAQGVLPLLVETQTCHLACPFLSCVVSANNPS